MFEISWMAMLSCFSRTLEEQSDERFVELAVFGFRCATRVACTFALDTARETLVASISNFASLSSLLTMEQKNIDCVRLMFAVALDNGNALDASWLPVLKTVSELERMHLISAGLIDDTTVKAASPVLGAAAARARANGGPKPAAKRSASSLRDLRHQQSIAREEERVAGIVAEQVNEVDIDSIFSSTAGLDGGAIVEFVYALCAVSLEELRASAEHPRIFSLQKIVEISELNMDRIRIVWSSVWVPLSAYFNEVGCHDSLSVAMYAIDSLRQLGKKFLEKKELGSFSFQKDFLRPFVFIFENNPSPIVRELVLRCMAQLTDSGGGSLKSGWAVIFAVLGEAAGDEGDKSCVSTALSCV